MKKEGRVNVIAIVVFSLILCVIFGLSAFGVVPAIFPVNNTNASAIYGYADTSLASMAMFNGTNPQFQCNLSSMNTTLNITRVVLFINQTTSTLDNNTAIINQTAVPNIMTTTPFTYYFNVSSSFNEGKYAWMCQMEDNASPKTINQSDTNFFTIDYTPPSYSSLGNSTGETLNTDSTLSVFANYSDALTTIHTVLLYANVSGVSNNIINRTGVDGVTTTNNTLINFSYFIAPSLANHVINFSLFANDSVNNKNLTTPIMYTIQDATKPGPITLNSPINGYNQTNTSVRFNFTVEDNVVSGMTCDINISQSGSIVQSISGISVTNGTPQINYTSTALSAGTYQWSVNCTDAGSNFNTSASAYTFTIDNQVPGFAKASITGATAATESTVAIGINVTDSQFNISAVWLTINDTGVANNQKNIQYAINNWASVNFTYTVPINMTGAVLNVSIYANDTLGNTNSTYVSALTITDGTKPGPFTMTSPIDGYNQTNTSVRFNFTVQDNHNDYLVCAINISQSGSIVQSIPNINVTPGTAQINYTASALSAGTYQWSVNCSDAANNFNTSASAYTFTIDNQVPGFAKSSITGATAATESTVAIGINVTDSQFNISAVWLTINDTGVANNQKNIQYAINNWASVNFTYTVPINMTGAVLNVSIYANDTLGNTNSTYVSALTITDGTKPGPFNLTKPINLFNQTATTVTFNFTAQDNGASALSCSINISQSGTPQQWIYGISLTPGQYNVSTSSALTAGTYQWSVNCSDTAGNVNTSTPAYTFTVDNLGPGFAKASITGTSAATESTVAIGVNITENLFNISAAWLVINDTGVADNQKSIQYAINNWASVNFTYTVPINMTGAVLNVSIYANDTLGNTNSTYVSALTITDGTKPGPFTLTSPIDGYNQTNTSVRFNFTAADNANTALTCTINISQSGSIVQSISNIQATPGTAQINYTASALAAGTYQWSVNCSDAANNFNTSASAYTFTIDNLGPGFAKSSITGTSAATESTVAIGVNVTDPFMNISAAWLVINDTGVADNQKSIQYAINNWASVNFTYTVPINMTGAVLNVSIYANDTLGNTNSTYVSALTITDGTVPGPITLNKPINGFNQSAASVSFNFTAVDNADTTFTCSVNVSQSAVIISSIDDITVTSNQAQVNSTNLANGTYQWSVNCSDAAGNTNMSVARTVTVDQIKPAFSNVSMSTSSASIGSTVYLSVAWNDNLTNIAKVIMNANISGITTTVNSSTSVTDNNRINLSYVILSNQSGQVLGFTMLGNDSVGNYNTTVAQVVTVTDTTEPGITLNKPINGFNQSTASVSFNFTAVDDFDTTFTCSVNVSQSAVIISSIDDITVTSNQAQVNSTNLANGTYQWSVNCSDTAGNTNMSLARTVTVDQIKPVFSNVSMSTTSASTGSTVYLSVAWNDNLTEVEKVIMFVNTSGTTTTANSSTSVTENNRINLSYVIPSDQTGAVLGFTMLGNDTLGNYNTTVAQVVSVTDGVNPTISVTSPANNSNITDSTPALTFTPSDNSAGNLTCNVTFNGIINTSSELNITSGISYSYNITAIQTDNPYNWSIICRDASNNYLATYNYSFTLDRSNPTITSSLSNNANITSTSSVTITLTDSTTGVKASSNSFTTSCGATGTFTTGTAFYPFNGSSNPCTGAAQRNLTINVTDHAGNANGSIFTFGIDNVGPNITIVSPSAGQSVENLVMFNWTSQDSYLKTSYIGYYLDDAKTPTQVNFSATGLGTAAAEFASNMTINLTAGNRTLIFTANDTLNNWANSSTITFVVVAQMYIPDLVSGLESTLGTEVSTQPILRIKNSSSEVYYNGTGYQNNSQTFELIINSNTTGTPINVTLTDLDGLSVNWEKINETIIKTNHTATYYGIQNNWTNNIFYMVYANSSLDDFAKNNKKYYGTVTLPVNVSLLQFIWWLEDETDLKNTSNRYNISECTSAFTAATTTPCWNYTSGGKTIVYVPHYSIIIAGNDTQPPTLTINKPATTQDVSGFMPNITVSSDASSCIYRINNDTNLSMTSATSNVSSAATPINNSCTWSEVRFKNGVYNLTFNATDANSNTNSTNHIFTMADNTAPDAGTVTISGTSTGATITITNINESANVTIIASNGTSFTTVMQTDFDKSQSLSISGISTVTTATTRYFNLTVCDYNGNCYTNVSMPFTQSATSSDDDGSSSSGGSGAGGSGGIATSNILSSKAQVWMSIDKGSTIKMTVDSTNIAFTLIEMSNFKKDLKNAELKVASLSTNPTSKKPTDNVVQYLEVTKKNFDDDDVTTITISFKVSKSWLTSNNIDEDNIVLWRYDNGNWRILPTTHQTTDSYNAHYEAISPGFSYFAIGTKEGPATPPRPPTEPKDDEQIEEPTGEGEPEEPVTAARPPKGEKKPIVGVIIALIIIIGAIVYFMIIRNRE